MQARRGSRELRVRARMAWSCRCSSRITTEITERMAPDSRQPFSKFGRSDDGVAMIVREYERDDASQVNGIFMMYWNDPVFLEGLSRKLGNCVDEQKGGSEKEYWFYVAEDHGEIVGVSGCRRAPDHMMKYAKTSSPAEFYVLASKYKGRGIGESLRLKRMEEAKRMGFTEIVFYSPDTHEDSWGFHDRLGFERVGRAIAPDGEPGMIWRREL